MPTKPTTKTLLSKHRPTFPMSITPSAIRISIGPNRLKRLCFARLLKKFASVNIPFIKAKGICVSLGDGGSALYFQPFNSSFPPLLYGIASFDTKQCDRHGFPIVYTSVVSHYYWFQAVIVGNVTVGSHSHRLATNAFKQSTPAEPDAEYYDELKLVRKEKLCVQE